MYHEFDCEKLYEELNNYKLHLEDCKADSLSTEEDIATCNAHLERVEFLISALEEIYDCME